MAMANKAMNGLEDSPIGNLPPELRNRIYDFVFAGLEDKLTIPLLATFKSARYARNQHHRKELALLLTCKQIHLEAAGYAWSRITAYDTQLRRYKLSVAETWDSDYSEGYGPHKTVIKYGPGVQERLGTLPTLLSSKLKFVQELTLTDKITLEWMEGRGEEHYGALPDACASITKALSGIRILRVSESHVADRAGDDCWIRQIATDGKDFDALLKAFRRLDRLVVISPKNALRFAKTESYSIAEGQVTHDKSGIVVYDGKNEPHGLLPRSEPAE